MTKAPVVNAPTPETLAEARAPRYTSYPTAVQFGAEVDTATYEGWLRALPPDRPVSVYVHIPFCRRLCWYCGCNMRVERQAGVVSDYVKALDREIEMVFWARGQGLEVSTLHLGGGSPDSLSVGDLDRLFTSLRDAFYLPTGMEIDAEVDPAFVSEAWISAAARHGLTRVSLGVQTFSPSVQAAVHRPQSFERISEVVAQFRGAGVQAVNFDLMYGLPLQSTLNVVETIEQTLKLNPRRIALFGYAHMPQLKLHQKLIDPASLPGVSERIAQAQAASQRLVAEGYERIGFDHFALPDDPLAVAARAGRLHRNFQGFTTDAAETLIGLGVSAISKTPAGYAQNHHALDEWRNQLNHGRLPVERGVALSSEDRLRARIIEKLMCNGWADVGEACEWTNTPIRSLDDAFRKLCVFEASGLVELHGDVVHATEAGRRMIRTVCTAFDAYFDPAGGRHAIAV